MPSTFENIIVNGFTLLEKIGEGGMAEVWYAENKIGKTAAVKILKEEYSKMKDLIARFENEAKAMVSLEHPGIRQILDFEFIDDRPCIIMEYLEGDDLKDILNKGRKFTNDELQNFWNQCVDALNYTHKQGVIHRDIKPSNIFLTKDNKIKILDFGIAKVMDSVTLTQTGTRMGTLMYMSPEQVKDSKHLNYKSDVYSLAVTFYHLLKGEAPYDGDTSSAFEIQTKIVTEELDLNAIPHQWKTKLEGHLIKKPDDRIPFSTDSLANEETLVQNPANIQPKGTDSIKDKYDFHCGLARVIKNNLYGFINEYGNEVIKPRFQYVDNFKENRARYKQGNKFGFIDTKGIPITDAIYNDCGQFNEGMAWVKYRNKYSYIDLNGYKPFTYEFTFVTNFVNKMAIVANSDYQAAVMNQKGARVSEFYNSLVQIIDIPHIFLFKKKNKWGILELSQGILIPAENKNIKYEKEIFHITKKTYTRHLVYKNGKLINNDV